MSTKDIIVKDIIVALRYCVSDTGEFCDMCKYSDRGPTCSKQLLRDASKKLEYYYKSKQDVNAR